MSSRKLVLVLLALVAAGAAAAGIAVAGHMKGNNNDFEYAVGLWGDLPYNDVQAQTGVPNLIADMNNSDISFSIHDGDLKAGSGMAGSATPTTCSDALYQQSLNYLNSLEAPAFFTPGDNDWTDCDRPANGSFNSLERLQHERQVMFSTNRSFGEHTMKAEVQSTPSCVGTTNTTAGSTVFWHVVGVSEPAVAFPALRSPSCTENSMSWLFMSAIRFGTPVCACTSEYGTSPQRPIAYSNFLSLPRSLPAIAKPAATAPAATTHSKTSETLRFDMLSSPRR